MIGKAESYLASTGSRRNLAYTRSIAASIKVASFTNGLRFRTGEFNLEHSPNQPQVRKRESRHGAVRVSEIPK